MQSSYPSNTGIGLMSQDAHSELDHDIKSTVPDIRCDSHAPEDFEWVSGSAWTGAFAPPFDSRDLLSPYAGSEYASSTCSVGSGFISEAGYLEHPNEGGEEAQPAKQKKIGKKRGPKPLKTELLSTDSREERRKKQMRLNWRAHSSKKKQEQETLHAQLTSLIQRNAELGTALASTKASVAGMTSILDAVATGGSVQITSDSLGSWPLSVQNLWMTVPGEYGSRRVYDAEASELGGSVGFDEADLESMGI